jgi:hypothetical protein
MRISNNIQNYRGGGNYCVSRAKDTSLQLSVLLTGIRWLPVTKKGRLPFCSANYCQSQQTPQSVYVQEFGRTVPSNSLLLFCRKKLIKSRMWFDNTLTLFPFCIQEHCHKTNAKEWPLPIYVLLALTEGGLNFRAPKFGLKNTSATKRCLDTILHKFRRGWVTIINLLLP